MRVGMASAAPLQLARAPAAAARAGRSAVDLTQTYLRGLKSVEGKIQSFISVDEELALQQAKDIDERLARGEDVGPLAGVCIAVKVSTE
jgi:aspartyl-tRNA(Asn)/glutamyl-tRNA(Gln) amidotransferase subunit A